MKKLFRALSAFVVAVMLNFDGQLKMICAFLPEAKTIGVLYTTSEANSISQIESLTEAAKDYDFEIKTVGITDASEVAMGAAQLIAEKIDVMNNVTDNNVVNNFSVVTNATDPAGIPIFGSEIEQVEQNRSPCCVGACRIGVHHKNSFKNNRVFLFFYIF